MDLLGAEKSWAVLEMPPALAAIQQKTLGQSAMEGLSQQAGLVWQKR
jgi:hypothetical protein